MTKKLTVEELLAGARKPAELAMAYHSFYERKVQIMPKCAIRCLNDFAIHSYDVGTVYKAITTSELCHTFI